MKQEKKKLGYLKYTAVPLPTLIGLCIVGGGKSKINYCVIIFWTTNFYYIQLTVF